VSGVLQPYGKKGKKNRNDISKKKFFLTKRGGGGGGSKDPHAQNANISVKSVPIFQMFKASVAEMTGAVDAIGSWTVSGPTYLNGEFYVFDDARLNKMSTDNIREAKIAVDVEILSFV